MHVSAHLDVDVVALEAEDDVTVLLELEAPAAPAKDGRAGQTLVVVLDRSGSMSGPPLEGAKDALRTLVDRLDPADAFGVVVFDDHAQVVVPTRRMGDHDRDVVKQLVSQIPPGGTTDLSAGYLLGLREARDAKGDTGATVLLVSDGHANAGERDPARLGPVAATATGDGVTTATLGIGAGYDEVLLAALAKHGNGTHRFAEGVDDAVAAIADEVDGLLAKSVLNAQVVLRSGPAVVGYWLYGDLPTWPAADGSLVVGLGDLYAGETRKLLVKIQVPGLAGLGLHQVTEIELRYVGLPELAEATVTIPVVVNVVPGDEAAGRVPNPKVRVEQLVQEAQTAKAEASAALREGRRSEAVDRLRTASKALRDGLATIGAEPSGADLLAGLDGAAAQAEAGEIELLACSAERENMLMSAKRNTESYSRRARGRRRREEEWARP